MGLIYRAIWEAGPCDVVDKARREFERWVEQKYPGLDPGEADAPSTASVGESTVSAVAQTVGDGSLRAYQATLVEQRPGERWSTRVRAVADDTQFWCWVDLERVASDVFAKPLVIAPRVATAMLKATASPHLGPASLAPVATVLSTARVESHLVSLIFDPCRTSAVVVFSHDATEEPKATVTRAQAAAEVLAGIATVFVLAPHSQQRFEELLGRDLSVWGGAARMYLPGTLDPWRHRYLRRDVVQLHQRSGGERFGQMLSAAVTARPAPALWSSVLPLLRSRDGSSSDELLAVAEEELRERSDRILELRAQLDYEQNSALDALAEVESLQDELKRLRGKLRMARFQQSGDIDAKAALMLPDSPTSLVEVADWVQQHLKHVELPAAACRDLALLDRTIEAQAWAETSWAGFRALNAYASDAADFRGGFWEWCRQGDNPDSWPATPKKLSMTESETVANHAKYRLARMLPVSTEVDSSGEVLMLSHLKIAEGGGGNAPRIYFHDGTASTGKVHVGFFGPHRHMPNSRSN